MASKHAVENYNISDLTSSIDRSGLITKLNNIIDEMNTAGESALMSDLVGQKTLVNGGILGDMILMMRIHIEDMKDRNELTEEAAGAVIGSAIIASLEKAVDYQFRNKDLNIKSKESLAQLAKAMIDIELAELGIAKTEYERKLLEFDLENLKPTEHEIKKEQVEQIHNEHLLSKYKLDFIEPANKTLLDDNHNTNAYNLTNILPQETLKLVKGNTLLTDDHNAKVYNLASILPQETLKLVKGNTLLDDDHSIKTYTRTEIMPQEKLKLSKGNILLDDDHGIKAYTLSSIMPQDKLKLMKGNLLLDDEHSAKLYTRLTLMPLDKVSKERGNILLVDDHNTKDYSLTNIMPQETLKLVKGNTLLDDEHSIKTYTLSDILPQEKLKIMKSNVLLDDDHAQKSYNLTTLSPLEKLKIVKENTLLDKNALLLDDEHCLKSTECIIRKYYKDNIQAEEKLTIIAQRKIAEENILLAKENLLIAGKELIIKTREGDIKLKEIDIASQELIIRTKEALIKDKELDIKTYELSHMMPAQISKINAEIGLISAQISNMGQKDALIAAQTCVTAKECDIKGYYHQHIQYQENRIAEAKAVEERVTAGWDEGSQSYLVADSMPAKKIEQMGIQNELYTRQIGSFDDIKYQKLLATQVNFAAMIFADDDSPDPLMGFANSPNILETHKLINPAATQST